MKMTLRTKILLACAVPLGVILLVIAGVLVNTFYNARLDSTWRLMSASVGFQASRIDADNQRAGDIAASLALAQVHGMFGDREKSIGYAREVLESSSQVSGIYIAYAPDADGADARMPAPGVSADALGANGRFVPHWLRSWDDPQSLSLVPDKGMESKHYYRGLQNLVQGRPAEEGIQLEGGISGLYRPMPSTQATDSLRMIGEPRVDQGRLVLRQSSPIIVDGAFKGVAGVERALDHIASALSTERALPSAEYILVSTRGRIVVATMDTALEGRRIEDTPYADLLGRIYREGEIRDLTILDDPRSGEERIFVAAPIATGDWRLMMSVSMAEVMAPVRQRGIQVLLAFIGGITIAVITAMTLLRQIIQRVESAATAVTLVADGDLTQQIDSAVEDESGQILRAIGNMVRSLDALIGRIKGSSLQLVSAATDISAAAQKQRDVSSGFGASTSEIAASTNEITATSRELLETMTQVSRATADTAGVANRGRSDLERMESTMQQLATATNSISAKLAVISERANKIGAVVTTITKVAEQTNLLSLNAAIEAEKAGEYGLGFSVVAREIRRLADQTAVATLDIERIVGEMQSSVSSGVMEMDRFDEQVREGVREAVRLGEQMAVIIEGVENLRPRFETAQQSMQSQVVGAGQINEAMMQLRETAMSSGATADGLHAAAAQMLSAVEALRAEVARFRTAGR